MKWRTIVHWIVAISIALNVLGFLVTGQVTLPEFGG
jgi:hypothetical protein